MSLPLRRTVASTLCWSFSTVMMTLTSMTWSKWLVILPSFCATCSRIAGVICRWWPVRCRFMLSPLLKGLSQVHREYLQRFPVFCDGAPCHDYTLLSQQFRDLAVAQRGAGVLRADQLFDQGADRRAGGGAARLGGDMAAEKILEFKDAARRM